MPQSVKPFGFAPACNKHPLVLPCCHHQTIEIDVTPQALILGKIQQPYLENSTLISADAETSQINVANTRPIPGCEATIIYNQDLLCRQKTDLVRWQVIRGRWIS